jgi:DNA repair photolyase
MILFASGRTDIPAFYSNWFINRVKAGFVDVRNPFNQKLVSRIYFSDVDLIMFCSKNPLPMINKLDTLNVPVLFHVTITPYSKDVEPNIPDKRLIIEGVKKLSLVLGIDNVVVRYDPIFLSDKYNVDYHIKAFDKLCKNLNGYVNKIIVSFMDEYKNVRSNKNILKYRAFTREDYKKIGEAFSKSAHDNGMSVQTCFEDEDLTQYGFVKGECLSHELAYILTGKKFKSSNVRKEKKCECVQMVDIGDYNSCMHMCKYCYANYDEKAVSSNFERHDDNSSLLIGSIQRDDVIKVRKK